MSTSPEERRALVQRVSELKSRGFTQRQIAERLRVSQPTVSRAIRAGAEPFGPTLDPGVANAPTPSWGTDQAPPPKEPAEFRRGYHDRTFRSFAAPNAFEGWSIERVRNAIALHDQGYFLESSLLAIIVRRFAPVFAALSQAIAPAVEQPRFVRGGARGLARVLREDIEAEIAPRGGLMSSPYFPTSLWGEMAVDLRMMGFSVLQHVYGDPIPYGDPVFDVDLQQWIQEDYVRPVYTRRWPTWAVQYYRYRRTFVAITDAGPVDIINGDGKFTLVADTEEPHFDGAVRPLGLEALDGVLTKAARGQYIDRYSDPKWWAEMPDKIAVNSDEGDAVFEAVDTIRSPEGWGVFPHGAKVSTAQMTAGQNDVFNGALENDRQYIAAILLGTDGTMSPGTGVYSSPMFKGVARNIVDRMCKAMARGVNTGHVRPQLQMNHAASIAAAAGWENPALEIPLPDPDADARMKSGAERRLQVYEIVEKEREAGFDVSQERVNEIAADLNVSPPLLAKVGETGSLQVTEEDAAKAARVREVRAAKGMEPLGDARDDLTMAELEAKAKAAAQGTPAPPGGNGGVVGGSPPDGAPGTSDNEAPKAPAQETATP